MVVDPITITPEKLIGEAFALMKKHQIVVFQLLTISVVK